MKDWDMLVILDFGVGGNIIANEMGIDGMRIIFSGTFFGIPELETAILGCNIVDLIE
jgi:hypothetical protein